jgi:hypothetical protein
MINITETAKQELKRVLSQNVDLSQANLWIMDRGQGIIGLGICIEAPVDRLLEYEGKKMRVVEPELADDLQGATIDVYETPQGPELVILD